MYTSFLSYLVAFEEVKSEIFTSIFSSRMVLSRSSVTIYDDQYNFYKAFNSEKLLVSFLEYMFEDIEPK